MEKKTINNLELDLHGVIYGYAPVQAEGSIAGNNFYFWARHDDWTLSVSESLEIDPVDIQNEEVGRRYGFFKQGKYGEKGGEDASYMPFEVVEKFVIDCLKDYVSTR
jgi:hypothetical protein